VEASLLKWLAPESLELLRGTPINCLIVPWAAGVDEDAEQQRQLQPLLAQARTLGLTIVGSLHPPADLKRAALGAHGAGLSALASPSLHQTGLALPLIEWTERDKIHWNNTSTVVALSDAVWPGIRGNRGGSRTSAVAGPTGIPWLDSNAWLIQWARGLCQFKSLWLAFEPEQTEYPIRVESYLLALADSESSGARWIVSLDDCFRSALDERQAAALEGWNQITAAVARKRPSGLQPRTVMHGRS
jgi:hypothetical protein